MSMRVTATFEYPHIKCCEYVVEDECHREFVVIDYSKYKINSGIIEVHYRYSNKVILDPYITDLIIKFIKNYIALKELSR